MYKIEFTNEAFKDIQAIYYILWDISKEKETAQRVVKAIYTKIETLTEMPYAHSIVRDEELELLEIRSIFVKKYTIFYSINEGKSTVYIENILPNGCDWKNKITKN